MIQIHFLGPLQQDPIRADIKTFDELKTFLSNIKDLDKQILKSSAIAVNDKIIQNPQNLAFKDGDIVCVLPPVCGG